MAGEDTNGKPSSTPIEVEFGKDKLMSADFSGGAEDPVLSDTTDLPASYEDGEPLVDDEGNPVEPEPKEDTSSEDGDGEGEPEAEEGGDPAEFEDLGEFDPSNEEAVSKFDAKYLKDGKVNFESFNAEFYGNKAKGGEYGLNEGTYAYLESLGIPRDAVKQHEAGVLAQQRVAEQDFYSGVEGGKASYDAAVAWGREHYNDDQKKAFNAAIEKGGEERAAAVEALLARHSKATGKTPAGRSLQERRRASPAKVVGGGAAPATGGVAGFADAAEHRAALKAAGSDPKKQAEVRARLRASKWARGS